MTKKTMLKHLVKALEIKAQMEELKALLEKEETALKKGMLENGDEVWNEDNHKVTYRPEAVQMKFNKTAFIDAYSEQVYNEFKRPVKQAYFRYR